MNAHRFLPRALRRFLVGLAACGVWQVSSSVAWAQTPDQFFDGDVVQDVRLVVSSRDWQTLKAHSEENTYYPADLTWNGVTVRNVGIRSRGSGTRNAIKPGLRVDINRYRSSADFLGLKAFVLDNAYSDASLIRESVSMKVFARMGMPAPREAHARLYVNNEYVGVYAIVEEVNRTFISRVFNEQEGNVETGGYLFEYKWVFPYEFGYLGSSLRVYAPLFEPQTRDTDSLVRIFGPIEDMVRTINESSDSQFAAAVGEYLDLRLVMKYLAIETFLVEWDGLVGNWATNNFYLYRFREGTRSQLIPWDKDHTFTFIDVPITWNLDTNVLVRRAMAVPELRQAYLDQLMQCVNLAGQPDQADPRGWLEREIDREANQIGPAIVDDPVFPFSFDEFQAEVEFMRQFARIRPSFVRCEVANAEDSSDSPQGCVASTNDTGSRSRTILATSR